MWGLVAPGLVVPEADVLVVDMPVLVVPGAEPVPACGVPTGPVGNAAGCSGEPHTSQYPST